MARLEVLKTYKLFINGQFPRGESGRNYDLIVKGRKVANVCDASRKDFRDAVTAARNAQSGWAGRSAYNRGQVIYRMAEILEGRRSQMAEELALQGMSIKNARAEVDASIDRLVYYAGWADKYSQVFSAVNPVASPHYNFSVPEPTGVVSIVAPEVPGLLGLISVVAPVITGGNTCVVLASPQFPLTAITFGEALATSDLPAGVLNILTSQNADLSIQMASHLDVNAMVFCAGDNALKKEVMTACAGNVKRFFHWDKDWNETVSQGPYFIADLQEIKTTWHPIEHSNGGSAGY